MSKLYVSSSAADHTALNRVRAPLDRAEKLVSDMHGSGKRELIELPHLLDQVHDALDDLEAAGADVRAERVRFESVQQKLRRRQGRFFQVVGEALREERESVRPSRVRWWWFLDKAIAQRRRKKMRWFVAGALVIAVLCTLVWFAYDRFLAPPPEVRQALQHTSAGEQMVQEGDLQAALAEFEVAATFAPDDSVLWVWQGVIHTQLGELDEAHRAFDTARSLCEMPFDFLLQRAIAYLSVGDLDAARADADQAIAENPESGRGYYVRAGIAQAEADYQAAYADLERAAELAHRAGDTKLEVSVRTQMSYVLQMLAAQQPESP